MHNFSKRFPLKEVHHQTWDSLEKMESNEKACWLHSTAIKWLHYVAAKHFCYMMAIFRASVMAVWGTKLPPQPLAELRSLRASARCKGPQDSLLTRYACFVPVVANCKTTDFLRWSLAPPALCRWCKNANQPAFYLEPKDGGWWMIEPNVDVIWWMIEVNVVPM